MKIGITASAFDLLHAGHICMLEEASRQCDYLIAAIQTNPNLDRSAKNAPAQSVVERYIQLRGCKYVDEIIPYETEKDLEDIFASMDIHIRILGVEYKDKDFTGRDMCKKRGIELYFNERSHDFSTSELRRRITDRSQ